MSWTSRWTDKNRNDILVAAGEVVIKRYRAELDSERPEDICECGDYRRDHPDDGACNLNGLGHGIPSREPEAKCLKFRLALQVELKAQIKRMTEPRVLHVRVRKGNHD